MLNWRQNEPDWKGLKTTANNSVINEETTEETHVFGGHKKGKPRKVTPELLP